MSPRLLIACVAGLVAVGSAAARAGAGEAPDKRPRPDGVPMSQVVTPTTPNEISVYNDYSTPEHTLSSARGVVHYVVSGINAPPLNDDDADGTPDYVERAGEAADTAISYYERRGFVRVRPDNGGPDSRPDVYLSRLAPGYLGIALPACEAEGGAFVVVSNNLDPSPEASFASLYGTVAHEIFHLVQFSYLPSEAGPELLAWVREGTAAAMEARVYPELDDLAATIQRRRWLWDSSRSLLTQTYATDLLWRYLDLRSSRLLSGYLALRAAGQAGGDGAAMLVSLFERLTGRSFASSFADFASSVVDGYAGELRPLTTLTRGSPYHAVVGRFAVHYLRLPAVKPGQRTITVTLARRSPGARVGLAYELESAVPGGPAKPRRILGRVSDGGRAFAFTIPDGVRRSARVAYPTVVVSNGSATTVAPYSVVVR